MENWTPKEGERPVPELKEQSLKEILCGESGLFGLLKTHMIGLNLGEDDTEYFT